MKTNSVLWIALTCMVFSMFACGGGGEERVPSENGTYEASLAGAEKGLKKSETASVTISIFKKDESTPVTDLKIIKVTFIHAIMGHGGDTEPELSKVVEGSFKINNLIPTMAGEWKLTIVLSDRDSIHFIIKVSE